jgi:DNA-binding transcriptional LysR family regulator
MKNIYLDTRLLELFCCVYEKGSITKSVNCLHLSQSTISFHINQLEKSIGLKLFYRKGRRLVPTSNAHILYPYAKKILELKLLALEEIKLISGSYKGHIRIGASSVPGTYLLPDILGDYLANNPNSSVEVIVEDSMKILSMVEEGNVDMGFIGFRCTNPDLEVFEMWEDTIHFVGSKGIPKNLSLDDLLKYPFILREASSGTRKFVENLLKTKGIDLRDLNIIAVVDKNHVILSLLRKVQAISFVSSYALRDKKGLQVIRVMDLEPIKRNFYLIYDRKRPQSPAVRLFIDQMLQRNLSKSTTNKKIKLM